MLAMLSLLARGLIIWSQAGSDVKIARGQAQVAARQQTDGQSPTHKSRVKKRERKDDLHTAIAGSQSMLCGNSAERPESAPTFRNSSGRWEKTQKTADSARKKKEEEARKKKKRNRRDFGLEEVAKPNPGKPRPPWKDAVRCLQAWPRSFDPLRTHVRRPDTSLLLRVITALLPAAGPGGLGAQGILGLVADFADHVCHDRVIDHAILVLLRAAAEHGAILLAEGDDDGMQQLDVDRLARDLQRAGHAGETVLIDGVVTVEGGE